MKKLEEMDLVDDFLAYSLTIHKKYGEEAIRYILECILGRKLRRLTVVPQKAWYGEQPEGRGVRLDIYLDEEDGEVIDLEPDKNSGAGEVAALPRRVRFYHSKIDAGILSAGEGYDALRNVVVIFIATYDPLGRNRLTYTIKNGCIEEPDLPYEDGARTIFLYTKGTEGEPTEESRQLARYMEHSTAENAKSAGLKKLHKMVTEVKADREVGLEYMKMCESNRRIREDAKWEGRTEGKIEDILDLLEDLGPVPEDLKVWLWGQRDLGLLQKWHKMAARSESIEEFEDKLVEFSCEGQ